MNAYEEPVEVLAIKVLDDVDAKRSEDVVWHNAHVWISNLNQEIYHASLEASNQESTRKKKQSQWKNSRYKRKVKAQQRMSSRRSILALQVMMFSQHLQGRRTDRKGNSER